ncbi:ABC-type transport auxiliary lipoprotein family protein [Alteromonas sp. ASW11-36]|uniref:ABC-type transport auxiliary lipoprotein family protein n=1 Tax=Alteromonas arenosi TaxID=3055817 RepID=A0ABT7SUR8_9ALTE|nr:ABC-type transport auxiliary lipoprotein family protein [Alteromonas sp. ASW11-36]MDM7859923.1 ABC-type transport auxiliary lipoprotein family protein [Alteromonas sp. ASW11-36]
MIRQLLCSTSQVILLAALTLVLVGCSSQPVVINYYMLNLATSEVARSTSDLPQVSIERVHLPEHLEQRSLVMQQSNGTLSIATKHVWAQPLDVDIAGLLATEITKLQSFDAYTGAAMSRHEDNTAVISVYVEHFMPLATGDVTFTGYWLERHNAHLQAPQRFTYQASLSADGYAASVAQMRLLIRLLAADISATMQRQQTVN